MGININLNKKCEICGKKPLNFFTYDYIYRFCSKRCKLKFIKKFEDRKYMKAYKISRIVENEVYG